MKIFVDSLSDIVNLYTFMLLGIKKSSLPEFEQANKEVWEILAECADCLGKDKDCKETDKRNAKYVDVFWAAYGNCNTTHKIIAERLNRNIEGYSGKKYTEKKIADHLDHAKEVIEKCIKNKIRKNITNRFDDDTLLKLAGEHLSIANPESALLKLSEEAENNGSLFDAIGHLETVLFIDHTNSQAKQKLLEIYPKAIQNVIEEGRYEDAFELTRKALELAPDNNVLANLSEGIAREISINKQSPLAYAKALANDFISKYYPEELFLFDVVWDILKDIGTQKMPRKELPARLLAATGRKPLSLKDNILYQTIAAIRQSVDACSSTLEHPKKESLQKEVEKAARKNGAAQLIIDRLVDYFEE